MLSKFIPIGNVHQAKILDGQLVLHCSEGVVKVNNLTNGAIHIQMGRHKDDFAPHSYTVVDKDQVDISSFKEDNLHITINCNRTTLRITKEGTYIDMLDAQSGDVILADERGLGTCWHRTGFTCYKKKLDGDRFVGQGGKTGPLDKSGQAFTCWNTDSFGFGPDTDPVYTNIPFYIGISNGHPYGIFLDNTSKTHFDFGASNYRYTSFSGESGWCNYYFFYTGDIRGILDQYSRLTGKAELPPKWSLGFQQCRYSYYPQSEVVRQAQAFRQKDIPADVIYLDIHYMDQYKVFTWHPEYFPDPHQLIQNLKDLGFKVVVIFDPGIKVEEGYEVYESGLSQDVFVKYIDGQLMEGDVWPGKCHYPDFTSPKARAWWGDYVKKWRAQGVHGFWNDMNEPAIWGKNFPDATVFHYEGEEATHLDAHNIYGMQMSRSTKEGAEQANANERTFVLTRAGFAGNQRYSAIWTGDNISNEEHIHLSARMITSLGLSGMPFSGADVGGFVGECSADLFKRWIAVGAFQPLFRSHTMVNSRAAEPWSFGEEAEEIARNYIALRYRLLPYWYSLFYDYTQTGTPPVRSLIMDDWTNQAAFDPAFENQFYVGDTILVCPIGPSEQYKKIYLPPGQWYSLYNDEQYEGGREWVIETDPHIIPVFVKAGAILPVYTLPGQSAEDTHTSIDLHIYGLDHDSEILWYDDDGSTLDHKDGNYALQHISIESDKKIVKFSDQKGTYKSPIEQVHIILHGIEKPLKIEADSISIKGEKTDYRFVKPITNFDPFYTPGKDDKTIFGVQKFTLPLQKSSKFFKFITD